ncbi:helix-turn-helix domain-containing protein [Pantoea sp. A4]|uniref:helix-turn-helix domain-containing protein n=1 Tax=Pantoea sp. A4 TaxID=1225184 RepID=UPI000AAD565D|nr:helix-turn-helix domain-containing protein [Pantoea sp. A4]
MKINQANVMNQVVVDMLTWIDDHLDDELKACVVTEKSGYTRWHFQRKFRQITGISLAEYIRYRRLQNAAHALAETDSKIMTIALDNGFTSQQSLTRLFRRYLGCTPTDVRRDYADRPEHLDQLLQPLQTALLPMVA